MNPYEVEFTQADQIYALHLSYKTKDFHPREIEQHLRDELSQWKSKCETDILVSPWYMPSDDDEELLPLEDGSTHLIYIRDRDEVLRWNDYRLSTQDTKETDEYFYAIQSHKTHEGIKPEKEWFSISVVFKSPTSSAEIYTTLIEIGEDWIAPGLEVGVYAYYGNPNNRITWEQIRDTDRKYMFVKFLPHLNQFIRDGKVLKDLN